MYPISKSVPLTYNPVETIWFPAVVTDEVSLHTILFSCAMHYFLGSGHLIFRDSDLLMKVILDRLNRRLQNGNYSDLTIGAISCMALCENHLGNHEKSRMHAAGMSDMIRARGGFKAVKDVLHMKIYRADTIAAVDTLSHPHLPRPTRTTASVYAAMAPDIPPTSIKPVIAGLGFSSTVSEALMELSHLCCVLNYAADKRFLVDPLAFDEDVICIQHDLLRSLNPAQNKVEKLCVLTALIFIQTLTREVPFSRLCASHISRELKTSLPAVNTATAPARLIFWMLFMGGLVSTETNEKRWFRTRLKDFQILRNDLFSWESMRAQLQQIFWVNSVQDPLGINLWNDVNSPSP